MGLSSREYSKEKTIDIINEVLNQFMENDIILLDIGANERTISHKIACYLDKKFENLDVDCEYNRDINNIKNISGICNNFNHVLPDIIVHKRLEDFNHLVIEIKKDASEYDKKRDIQKLNCLKKKFNYNFALFISFDAEKQNPEITWDFDREFDELLDINCFDDEL